MEDANEVDFIVESLVQENEKVLPVVALPDGKGTMYKSTLVSMLNDNKTVSKERSTCVRNNNIEQGCSKLDSGEKNSPTCLTVLQ